VTGEYESGDVNTIAEEDEFDDEEELEDEGELEDGELADELEDEGELEDEDEDDYEDGDVNAVASESSYDDMAGNRSEGSTPTSVLTYIAKALSDEPDAVVVPSEARRGSVRLRLHVAPEDMGRVIGRRGRTAQAIRALVGAAGAHDGVQTSVDIVDD
jgi:predicted RNA-binding protein YlqC (UPF0109 family)